ncbi:hypothetical protein [Nocardia brasiliensis]
MNAAFFGIPSGSGIQCTANATMRWHNLDTGMSGSFTGQVCGGYAAFCNPALEFITTGSGRVEFELTTDHPHMPSNAVLDVF